jgi:hypothetical protein
MPPKTQLAAVAQANDLAAVLQQTNALVESEHLFAHFDQADMLMPRLAWNMGKSGMKNPATGRRIANDEFFDLRNEVSLGTELKGTLLYVAKGFDFRRFDGEKTIVHCQSVDRVVGHPRTDLVKPERGDGSRACAGCPHKQPQNRSRDDGKTLFMPDCLETYDALFLHAETSEVFRMTLRGRSYRQFRPLVQKFFHVRVGGRLVNVPWFARQVTAKLVMADKADYAICTWEVGDVNPPDLIRWAAGWVQEHMPRSAEPAE